jgi:hypothetical protein
VGLELFEVGLSLALLGEGVGTVGFILAINMSIVVALPRNWVGVSRGWGLVRARSVSGVSGTKASSARPVVERGAGEA